MAPGVYNLAAISLISKLTGTDFYPAEALDPAILALLDELELVALRDDFSSRYLACAIFCSLSS